MHLYPLKFHSKTVVLSSFQDQQPTVAASESSRKRRLSNQTQSNDKRPRCEQTNFDQLRRAILDDLGQSGCILKLLCEMMPVSPENDTILIELVGQKEIRIKRDMCIIITYANKLPTVKIRMRKELSLEMLRNLIVSVSQLNIGELVRKCQ